MPDKPHEAAAFMVKAEDSDRKNGRVSDKVLLALPRELDAQQRAELVRAYAEDVTQGRAPWLAAFHDQGKDAHNPHAHLLIRDRDPTTGRRVAGLSEQGSTEKLRTLWEDHTNRALQRAGRSERIDRRTLEAQGIRREPTVHEGPKARQMERRGAQPESRERRYRNRPGSRLPHRHVDYRDIDKGRSRPAYNRNLRETETDYWQAVDAANQASELDTLRVIHHPPDTFGHAGKTGVEKPHAKQHSTELVELPLVAGRVEKPTHSANKLGTGVGFGRSFTQLEANQEVSPLPALLEPKQAPFETHSLPKRKRSGVVHPSIYGSSSKKDNEKMVKREDDDSPEARWQANEAKKQELGGTFDYLAGKSYEDKDTAMKNMGAFRHQHGSDELFHALRNEPHRFGPPPKDHARAVDASRYTKELPYTYHDYGKAHDEGERLKHLASTPSQGGASGGQDKPSGLSSMWSSSPSKEAENTPKHSPTSLQSSSYPLESPFRAEGQSNPQPASQAQDEKLEARRRMMDQMRDRQAKEKEMEKQKGKGFGYGE